MGFQVSFLAFKNRWSTKHYLNLVFLEHLHIGESPWLRRWPFFLAHSGVTEKNYRRDRTTTTKLFHVYTNSECGVLPDRDSLGSINLEYL